MTDLNTETMPWPISQALIDIIQNRIKSRGGACIVSFRDPSYTAGKGGFHPVEILVDASGRIQYITDFFFVGQGQDEELAKELDWDFSLNVFQQMGREFPLEVGREMFKTFQRNFVSYYQMGVFETTVEDV